MSPGRSRHSERVAPSRPGERGASLVEMSIVLLLFFTLAVAIFEFAYVFAQNNQVGYVTREAARVAGVDGDVGAVEAIVCGNTSLFDPGDVSFSVLPGSLAEEGGDGLITVDAGHAGLTNMLSTVIPDFTITSSHTFFTEPGKIPPFGVGTC